MEKQVHESDLCKNLDCAYFNDPEFADKCKDCSEHPNADPETAIFHYEEVA